MTRHACWCGNRELLEFSPDYRRCAVCETLVSSGGADASSQYTADYWFHHQTGELGLPDITERARLDLHERCIHWLRTVLEYRLPPASCLEIGCSHGGFVSMLRLVGFEATGLELDGKIAEIARKTFAIPVLQGPLQEQQLQPHSLDIIVMMDVLEHLPRPADTIRPCIELLKPDGIILLQTPRYPEGSNHAELAEIENPFLRMLLPDEHVFLFSRSSLERMFTEAGAPHIAFEPALFPHDMFAVVSQRPLTRTNVANRLRWLTTSPERRLALALLDARDRLMECEKDRAARLELILRQDEQIKRLDRPVWRRLFDSRPDR